MFEHETHWMDNWMGAGHVFGPLISALVVILLVVVIIRLIRK